MTSDVSDTCSSAFVGTNFNAPFSMTYSSEMMAVVGNRRG
jgi:hypothetical protein